MPSLQSFLEACSSIASLSYLRDLKCRKCSPDPVEDLRILSDPARETLAFLLRANDMILSMGVP